MLKVIRSKLHTLLVPLLFWLCGIVLASKYSYHWMLNFLVLACFLTIIFLPKLRTYLILILFFLLGWLYTSSYLQPADNNISNFLSNNKPVQELFEYKVLEQKQTSKAKIYYIIKLNKLNQHLISGKVLLFHAPDSLQTNHLYQTPLTINRISKPHNPAEFDFFKFYSYSGIQGRASAIGITKELGTEENLLQGLKAGIISKLETTFEENKSMALALFLGEKGLLQIDQERLSQMGLLHLFAVSGLHVGIIYLTILTLINIILDLNRARLGASLLLIFYGFLCGWSPSVFRTVLIIIIYNLTLIFQRKISFLQLLSLTLFIITISNPLKVFSVGLHLSLAAFISLWLADRVFIPQFNKLKRKHKLNKYLFNTGKYLIYSLSVILFIAPLSAYYFDIISLNAVITNVIATPLVTLMLNVILISLFIPQGILLQEYLSTAFDFLNHLFELIVKYAGDLPLFTRNISLTGSELLFLIVSNLIASFLVKKKRVWGFLFIALASLFLILKISGLFVIYQDQVICFDAGNADCSYLEFADKGNLLIDTGSQEKSPNIIKTSLLPYLRKKHIHSLDCVIITHPHEDHYGGLPLLAQTINIKEVIFHQTALQDDDFNNIINDLKSKVNITIIQDTLSLWGQKLKFLHPDASYKSDNMNNNSLVAMISMKNYKLLFTGDIEEEAERRLISQYGNELNADFLKVPHHGSISSSTEEFLNLVNPSKCFIPAGNKDRDKFPNPLVIKRLNERNVDTVIGNIDGALMMKIKE